MDFMRSNDRNLPTDFTCLHFLCREVRALGAERAAAEERLSTAISRADKARAEAEAMQREMADKLRDAHQRAQ